MPRRMLLKNPLRIEKKKGISGNKNCKFEITSVWVELIH